MSNSVDAHIGKPKAESVEDLVGLPKSETVEEYLSKPRSQTLLQYLEEDDPEPVTDYVAMDEAASTGQRRHQSSVGISSPRTRVVPPSRTVDAFLAASAHTVVPSPQVAIGMDAVEAFRNLDGGVCLDDPTMCWAVDSMPLLVSKFERYIDNKKV